MHLEKGNKTLRRWELALLLGVAIAAMVGAWLCSQQADLADRILRLHVIANSDSEEDQTLKLAVRDRILSAAEALYEPGGTVEEAKEVLSAALPALAEAGVEVVAEYGYDYPVAVSLQSQVWFPTKEYQDFALPAGNYQALRVVIGDGAGQNWWCVVFPPLCLGSVSETTSETALSAGLDEQQVALITGESEGYVVKFKALEIIDSIREHFS